MAPKKLCAAVGCGVRADASNSATVMDLPGEVKAHVLRELKCAEDCVLCYKCIKGTAFSWGFPRGSTGIESAIRHKSGACAVGNYACEDRGRKKLRPIPRTSHGAQVDDGKVRAKFEIPPWAAEHCLCHQHYCSIINFIAGTVAEVPLSAKRPKNENETEKSPAVATSRRATVPSF